MRGLSPCGSIVTGAVAPSRIPNRTSRLSLCRCSCAFFALLTTNTAASHRRVVRARDRLQESHEEGGAEHEC
jgi:hypothetical protein